MIVLDSRFCVNDGSFITAAHSPGRRYVLFNSFLRHDANVVSLTLPYNNLRVVIPVKVKAGIQVGKTGFLIKSGMTAL